MVKSKPDWKFYVGTGVAVLGYLLGGLGMFINLNADVEKLEVRIEYITKEIEEIKKHVYHIRFNTAEAEKRMSKGVI